LFVGGDGSDRAALGKALEDCGCDGHYAISGFLSPPQVRTALAASTLLVLPSRREAFGSVLLEAMAMDVPTVAYATGGIEEVAGLPAAIHLVPPQRPAEFVRAVLQLLGDEPERQRLVEHGRTRRSRFDLARAADRVRSLYKALLTHRVDAGIPRP
jgi:glycosyltransferase involved in cell wall biosynthesis